VVTPPLQKRAAGRNCSAATFGERSKSVNRVLWQMKGKRVPQHRERSARIGLIVGGEKLSDFRFFN